MDLICYLHPGWAPRIRPASPKREWMEGTPERFAYRCLPLAIANAHGWEILSPCGFEARWTGGQGAKAVEIRLDPDADEKHRPFSLFGQGTITFHVEGVFRTPEGWNLMVGGPPNAAKDGIAPLAGVIETDWSPYTFTMNWRFTRKDHWVRFEENEPICFFFPVERGRLAGIVPRLAPMTEEEGLSEAFGAWSQSRDAFQKWVEEAQPSAPADKWQKLYYRGIRPDGSPGAADHDSKLRLAPFVQPDGTPMTTEEPAPSRPARRATAAAVAPALAATPAMPVGNDALAMALSRAGFDPLRAAPAAMPVAKPGRVEQRRDWLLATQEKQRALAPGAREIPRLRDLSGEEFLERFYAPGRPVVIEGALSDWPAVTRWTPDYLKRKIGKAEIEYQSGRDSAADFELAKDRHKVRGSFAAFIDRIGRRGNDAYLTAYNSAANRAALKPLDADLGRLDAWLTDGPGMLWIGPGGTFTPLHFDLTNNLIAQVVGTKELILAPPSETAKLAHNRHVFSDVHDLADPKRLAAFPQAKAARTFKVALKPGDAIYVPIGWWHQVRARDFSATLTYTNFRWPNEGFDSFPAD